MSVSWKHRFLVAALCAGFFTLALNARNLSRAFRGALTAASLTEHYIDERYYMATIGKVGKGESVFGHASFLEHRNDAPSASLAPAIEGLLMRWLHLSLPYAVLLGDVLFPFLAIALLTLGLQSLSGGSLFMAGAVAVIIGSDIGTYWFRSANPQIPFVMVMAWFTAAFVMHSSSVKASATRGVITGLMTWVHLVYASFFVIADAVFLVAEFLQHRSWKRFLQQGAAYGLVFIVCVLPRLLLSLSPEVAQDTFYRLGVVLSHAPSAPRMQIVLLCFLVVLLFYRWQQKRWPSIWVYRCFLLLVAALIGLNQTVIHGFDLTFVSYYQPLIRIVLLLTVCGFVIAVLPFQSWRRWVIGGIALLFIVRFQSSVSALTKEMHAETLLYEQSGAPQVIAWLREQQGPLVIAAPNILNEWIPGETQHYVLFNEYGWNQPMSDTELAERYALQVRLIPSSVSKDKTYTFVFGGHAGLQAAKERTICRIRRMLLRTDEDCVNDPRSLIRHQELLPVVDYAAVDVSAMMRKYYVEYVVTQGEDKGELPAFCRRQEQIENFTVWNCRSDLSAQDHQFPPQS